MQTQALKTLVIDALEGLKGKDVIVLDVAHMTSVTDLMVIASGTSTRHVSAMADNVVEEAKHAGMQPLGVEGRQAQDWVLVDLGDVVVHVMTAEARAHYDLERLWGELPISTRDNAEGGQV